MQKILLIATALVVTGLFVVGCSSGGAEMSKDELDSLKNPRKTIPPEAAKGMANQGEAIRKTQEANKAAGIDDRGIPINKGAPPSTPK